MSIEAIVYTSNTGNTAQYAKLLVARTGLPAYSAQEAQEALAQGACVVYMGWIRASVIVGYKEAAARYAVACVLAVGMGETGGQLPELRKRNGLDEGLPLFTLQGGLFPSRLRGMNAFMINFSRRKAIKVLKAEKKRTEAQNAMLIMLSKGASFVQEKHLQKPLFWLQTQGIELLPAQEDAPAEDEKAAETAHEEK